MVTECRKLQDAQGDDRDHAGIDQHAEHQPLVHHGENLPPLPDKSEPLGPWRDESGRRCVHRAGCSPWNFPGLAMLLRKRSKRIIFRKPNRLCHRPGRAVVGLSTDFFERLAAAARPAIYPRRLGGREARLIHELLGAGFAAVTGLAVDLEPAAWGEVATGFDGTSRVPVFKLA